MTSPPCQAFSLAGKRLGKDDKRGVLFFNSHEFIQVNKPRFFIFENVKGLLSDDGGKTFQEWLDKGGINDEEAMMRGRKALYKKMRKHFIDE
jgi:site-specific DNA-cytosine methylase